MTERDRIALWISTTSLPEQRRLAERARRRGFGRFARRRRETFHIDGIVRPLRPKWVGSALDLRQALRAAGRPDVLLLAWTGDRVIPLENAVASVAGQFPLGVLVDGPAGVPAALGALERGAELVVVPIRSEADLDHLEALVERPPSTRLRWRTVMVDRIKPVGLGDRVIVDTTRLLGPDAGLLVGSAAHFLFPVVSETIGSTFSRPRPFRVNAGSPHSYVLMADGSTRCLAELEPGDRLLIVGTRGRTETARVGRLKIERRPMVLVAATVGAQHPTVFVQEAETVRLLGPAGPVAVTQMARGQRLRGVELPAGRHLGDVVHEEVVER